MAVYLNALVNDMRRYLDLATFDVVVSLEGEQPTYTARIRVPVSRVPDVERFCNAFGVAQIEWQMIGLHDARTWAEATFPVALYTPR